MLHSLRSFLSSQEAIFEKCQPQLYCEQWSKIVRMCLGKTSYGLMKRFSQGEPLPRNLKDTHQPQFISVEDILDVSIEYYPGRA